MNKQESQSSELSDNKESQSSKLSDSKELQSNKLDDKEGTPSKELLNKESEENLYLDDDFVDLDLKLEDADLEFQGKFNADISNQNEKYQPNNEENNDINPNNETDSNVPRNKDTQENDLENKDTQPTTEENNDAKSNNEESNDPSVNKEKNKETQPSNKEKNENQSDNEKDNEKQKNDEEKKDGERKGEEKKDAQSKDDKGNNSQNNNDNQPNSEKNNGVSKNNDTSKEENKSPEDGDTSKGENKSSEDNDNEKNKNGSPSNKENNLDNKRKQTKQKDDNRRNKNRAGKPNSGNLKDRAKNAATNYAKNKVNNNPAVRKAMELKNKYDKAKKRIKQIKMTAKITSSLIKSIISIVSTIAGGGIPLVIIIVVVAIIACVMLLLPGIRGDTQDNTDNYSSTDQKTIEKLRGIFEDYPNADGALAMITVVYPYNNILWSIDTQKYVSQDYLIELGDDAEETVEEGDDAEEVLQDETDKEIEDVYLILFRKYKYRRKLKNLLKKMQEVGEQEYYNYLKTTYFNDDEGYKSMMEGSSNQELLKNYIIEDLKNSKDLFVNYVFQNSVCAASMTDAGQVSTPDLLKANILIDLKKPGCSSYERCTESYYDSYLSLEDYVKGVVYEEITGNTDINQIAAQMVAAKTFTLSRRPGEMDKDEATGSYIIPMLWSTADQDFCNIELGCNSDDIKEHYGYETTDERLFHGANRGPATEEQKKLYDEAWELTKNVYVSNSDGSPAETAYYAGCSAGKCMDQSKLSNYAGIDFKSILATFYSSYVVSTIDGDLTNLQVSGAQVCTNSSTNYSSSRAKIASFALNQVDKIPFYDQGLASVAGFDGNSFGTKIEADSAGRTEKGLGTIGFINWVYWSVVEENFGNQNNVENIISNTFSITQDKLLMGDIGFSSDKTVIAIYVGDNKWVMEDSNTGNVVAKPDDRITEFVRLNLFKNENYNFSIRTETPTTAEWGGNKMLVRPASASLIGECPWYAKNRAAEIIQEVYKNGSITKKQYDSYYERVKNTRGNGQDFYPGGPADNGYKGSTNIEDIKAGSFISMSSQKSAAGKKYGHVAVIEYVSENKIIITEGWRNKSVNKCSNYSDFSCITFRKVEFNSFQEFRDYYSDPTGYQFKGYLYFLED